MKPWPTQDQIKMAMLTSKISFPKFYKLGLFAAILLPCRLDLICAQYMQVLSDVTSLLRENDNKQTISLFHLPLINLFKPCFLLFA